MTRRIERFRHLTREDAIAVLCTSLALLAGDAGLTFGLGFQPGWANGWPGLSKHSVFATFISTALFVAVVSGASALAAFPCSLLQRLVPRPYVGWGALALGILAAAVLAAILSVHLFPEIRASIANEWH
jgi:hypothetical protein